MDDSILGFFQFCDLMKLKRSDSKENYILQII